MLTSDLDYHLPPDRVATHPASPRDSARLMVVSRTDPGRIEHAIFRDLPAFLCAGDVVVRNRTRVVRARLEGRRADTGGKVEGLFLAEHAPGCWEVLLKSNGRLRAGALVDLAGPGAAARVELIERAGDGWLVRVDGPAEPAPALLERVGWVPLPPYILKARRDVGMASESASDGRDYQTLYASPGAEGSVAAPTAGLHFTPGVESALRAKGVGATDLLLHVGPGTFKPIESARVEDHPMHAEWAEVPARAITEIDAGRERGGRAVVVGTTTCRALESVPPGSAGWSGWTRLLIAPGTPFARTDALITNFHLPRSTLLLLVGALFDGGLARVRELYGEAVARGYRFYSYGDAMLILP